MFSKLRLEEVYLKTVEKIKIESSDNNEFVHEVETTFGRNSPPIQPNCRLLELNTTGVPKIIRIGLQKSENVSFQINIVEKNMALAKRRLNSFAYNGPFIGLDNLHEAQSVSIGLRVKQSQYSDQDVEANCVIYPNKFKSFRDCDENFTNGEMQKIGVMPFWAMKGNTNLTKSK